MVNQTTLNFNLPKSPIQAPFIPTIVIEDKLEQKTNEKAN